MRFIFDFAVFHKYYTTSSNLMKVPNIMLIYFKKQYNKSKVYRDYTWVTTIDNVNYAHPYLKNMLITYNKNYIFFNIPSTVGNNHYANHFSLGLKDQNVANTSKTLVDLHFTLQNNISTQSYNENTKYWLYDGIIIDTDTIKEVICRIPRKHKMKGIFTDAFIDYIILILVSPFFKKRELTDVCNRINNPI